MPAYIKTYNNIQVLRDDLLPGGTKSILLEKILDTKYDEYVYASPVYGAAQIALSAYCKSIGKKATIFCAERKTLHENTERCIELGAKVVQVPYGYLKVVQYNANKYCEETGANLLPFGFDTQDTRDLIADRTRSIINAMGYEPDEIWCAVGSGVLMEGILQGTNSARINGVQVGKEYEIEEKRNIDGMNRVTLHRHELPFEKPANYFGDFPSTPNYDLKAWEFCNKNKGDGKILFWNVY